MIDIRQSSLFSGFMHDLKWETEEIEGQKIYLRKFPIVGYFAKMPRPAYRLNLSKIAGYIHTHKIFKFKIAPFIFENDPDADGYRKLLLAKFSIEKEPFNPTTTIQIDLTQDENKIFDGFEESKRRGVRRALKNNIIVRESEDYDSFVNIRKTQYSPMGFLVCSEMKHLWNNFYPKNGRLLLAYQNNKPLAGIFLLFFDKVAYYWYASALKSGKKLFAPTFLVWEALKLSKKMGCTMFEFEGIYDPRFPKISESWKGFTKFKEGFGGKKKVLIENFTT
jgi:peptidoglycan pentaglycine glycine transferase (the first glycine)